MGRVACRGHCTSSGSGNENAPRGPGAVSAPGPRRVEHHLPAGAGSLLPRRPGGGGVRGIAWVRPETTFPGVRGVRPAGTSGRAIPDGAVPSVRPPSCATASVGRTCRAGRMRPAGSSGPAGPARPVQPGGLYRVRSDGNDSRHPATLCLLPPKQVFPDRADSTIPGGAGSPAGRTGSVRRGTEGRRTARGHPDRTAPVRPGRHAGRRSPPGQEARRQTLTGPAPGAGPASA